MCHWPGSKGSEKKLENVLEFDWSEKVTGKKQKFDRKSGKRHGKSKSRHDYRNGNVSVVDSCFFFAIQYCFSYITVASPTVAYVQYSDVNVVKISRKSILEKSYRKISRKFSRFFPVHFYVN